MESSKVSSPARFCWLGSVLLCGPLILLILFTRHSWGSEPERGHQLNIPIYVEILQENVHYLEYTQMQTERVILTPPCSSHGADLPNLSPCPPHRVSPLPPAWLVPPLHSSTNALSTRITICREGWGLVEASHEKSQLLIWSRGFTEGFFCLQCIALQWVGALLKHSFHPVPF